MLCQSRIPLISTQDLAPDVYETPDLTDGASTVPVRGFRLLTEIVVSIVLIDRNRPTSDNYCPH